MDLFRFDDEYKGKLLSISSSGSDQKLKSSSLSLAIIDPLYDRLHKKTKRNCVSMYT